MTVAAASLPGRQAIMLGFMVLCSTAALFLWALPLPWQTGAELILPPLYRFGVGLALVTGVVFTAAYAWRVAADAEKLELALATTQDVLQREQRLAALGGWRRRRRMSWGRRWRPSRWWPRSCCAPHPTTGRSPRTRA